MDSVSNYSLASLAWLSAQAVPLIVWPSLVSTLLRADSPQHPGIQYSPANAVLEQYFARSLGLTQLALGGLLLVLSGVLPLDSMADAPEDAAAGPTPSASAVVLISALYHAAAASYSYARYYTTGQVAYLLGCLGGSVLATFGLWVLMFAGAKNRRVSRRTGADKETSGWPFKNVEADKKKKKKRF
ncbi:hypothetical protein C8A03DRAFT_30316 [Achaetomium macrosporum]|uniref:Uncharacterized protein n=1 Tax=Achaetomium macrosporum TaxID=79813 RepID=A0AAN7H9N1_9PEZI|nr:hypothetical protein C8A03DRAFT_30316 [Achaetomium macrosporum]